MKITTSVRSMVQRHTASMQTKLLVIFLVVMILPIVLLSFLSWRQMGTLGRSLNKTSVDNISKALNDSAVLNIERMSTDIARRVAEFLYRCDQDLRTAASLPPSTAAYAAYVNNTRSRVVKPDSWRLNATQTRWERTQPLEYHTAGISTNPENNDMDGFRSIPGDPFAYVSIPVYDEIAFVDLNGMEKIKAVAKDSPKKYYPMNPSLRDVSRRENTYVKAENWFAEVQKLKPGEIYVSDVIGAYVKSNFIGMYTPAVLAKASADRGYAIEYAPQNQAYSGQENPVGRRFEGIIRFATPVAGTDGRVVGYVTLALNHDHIMEFVDHVTPMDERYTELPDAFEGNYAFIWDYKCRNICHPRHHSIVGYNPETGDPEVPWLEASLYAGWRQSGVANWFDYLRTYPEFHEQSRKKKPAAELTRAGLVGLDGRYLNNAPQCTGWMDLTANGGSGSFYILWSGLYKLNTAAAIPYYTGQYAPGEANGWSRRGFGFVAIGSGLEHFTAPAQETEERLAASLNSALSDTLVRMIIQFAIMFVITVVVAVLLARHISSPIKKMAQQMERLATGDIAGVHISSAAIARGDEIGFLARSLNNVVATRYEELEVAEAIANGDYTRNLSLRSDLDLLGKALNMTVHNNNAALGQVSKSVKEVGANADLVSNVAQSLANSAHTLDGAMKAINASVHSMEEQSLATRKYAQNAMEVSNDTAMNSDQGYAKMEQLTATINKVQDASKKISTIAKIINDIAFQTNLLALNASVEAARAGRHGKGFAVVADEVRNLAGRSTKAVADTEAMIRDMQMLIDEGVEQVAGADAAFKAIRELSAGGVHVSEGMMQASAAQEETVNLVKKNLASIESVTQEASLNSGQMANSASVLSRQTEGLNQMLSHFRLSADAHAQAARIRHKTNYILPHSTSENAGGGY